MRQHRLFVSQLHPGEFSLEGAPFHHLIHVLRARPMTKVELIDSAAGLRAHAHVSEVRDHDAILMVGELEEAADAFPLWLLQGIAKGDKCDAIVRDATELGVTAIRFVETEHTVVRIDGERALARVARWQKIAEEAARQAMRTIVPTVDGPDVWFDALEAVPDDFVRIVLWEQATEPLIALLEPAIDASQGIAFAVGPEGGLSKAEVETARRAGWHVASLGKAILRTETVAAAVLGAVRVLAGS